MYGYIMSGNKMSGIEKNPGYKMSGTQNIRIQNALPQEGLKDTKHPAGQGRGAGITLFLFTTQPRKM
jgi:hypothetical protein